MQEILLIALLIVSLALVGVILLQQGKGAGLGASFGAGASGTVFGAPGSANVLTRITTGLAIAFFGIALGLAAINPAATENAEGDIFDQAAKAAEQAEQPAATASETSIPTQAAEPAAVQSDIPVEAKQEKPAEAKPDDKQTDKDDQ